MNTYRFTLALLALSILLWTCDRAQNSVEQREAGLNHLAGQQSPYLLQHVNNPVDWYPWGDEALAKAKAENKLLVISIGYSSCHWCHVMEHESFEDSLVAAVMNEFYVSIKVDREERPDVDNVYMNACELTVGQGCGWPLNAIALPDGRPVWVGTYFPREEWLQVLRQFADRMAKEADKMDAYATALNEAVGTINDFRPAEQPLKSFTKKDIDSLAVRLQGAIDFELGGLRGELKFPRPAVFEFLLAHHFYTEDETSLRAVETTLDAIANGGINDQLRGGFARYSTDERWLVPHFEKMLYDNAQLVSLYAHAYQATGKERYAEVVRQTLQFLGDELASGAGFASSLDADTDGEEGLTYVWTAKEITNTLGNDQRARAFMDFYGVTEKGNWEDQNVLFRATELTATASRYGYARPEILAKELEQARQQLLEARNLRAQPARDGKMLMAWNALAVSAYTDAYRALGEPDYLERAVQTGEFLWTEMRQTDGGLYRSHLDGKSAINAFLDDYALLAQACIDLYEVTFEEVWLTRAQELVAYADAHFWNPETKLYRYTSNLDPGLISRDYPRKDQAIPSGNSLMARVLHQLGTLLATDEMVDRGQNMLAAVHDELTKVGVGGMANWGSFYLESLHPYYEVAILGADAGAMRDRLAMNYLPDALFLGGTEEGYLELLENKLNPGQTTIYVCLRRVCQLPVTSAEDALRQMGR